MSVDDEMVGAIREAIAPMWRDTQDRISNLRDSLRKDIEGTKTEISKRIEDSRAATDARLQAVENRLAGTIASLEKLSGRMTA